MGNRNGNPRFFETKGIEPLDLTEVPALPIADGSFGRMGRHQQSTEFHGMVSGSLRAAVKISILPAGKDTLFNLLWVVAVEGGYV